MKRSSFVSLSLLTTVASAALAAGCGSKPAQQTDQGWQTCVDRGKGVTVEQQYCDEEQTRTSQPGFVPHYGWYYFPRGPFGGAPGLGMPIPAGGTWGAQPFTSVPVAHGTSTTSAGRPAATGNAATTTRGGFGSTASGHASGGE